MEDLRRAFQRIRWKKEIDASLKFFLEYAIFLDILNPIPTIYDPSNPIVLSIKMLIIGKNKHLTFKSSIILVSIFAFNGCMSLIGSKKIVFWTKHIGCESFSIIAENEKKKRMYPCTNHMIANRFCTKITKENKFFNFYRFCFVIRNCVIN